MKKLFLLLAITLLITSCNDWRNDTLSNHCGEKVLGKDDKFGDTWDYVLFFKEDDGNLTPVRVNIGEYDFYQNGDSIDCSKLKK
jgi:hypothetical protein